MQADRSNISQITETVIGCAFRATNTLGAGFLERVYENTLALERHDAGLTVAQQIAIEVTYKNAVVGNDTVDLLAEDRVLV